MEMLVVVVLAGVGLAYFFVKLLLSGCGDAREGSRDSRPEANRTVRRVRVERHADGPDAWKSVVQPVRRGDEMVMLQTTRANQKPTIEPFVEDVEVPFGVIDLRGLESRRVRVAGVGHYIDRRVLAWTYLLEREPRNRYDVNAVRVLLLDGVHVGYVPATAAKSYAPLLDALGDRFMVTGVGSAGTTSSRLWVDLPRLPALRSFVSSAATS